MFLSGRFGLLVGVVGAVEGGEALEVGGGPGVFALQEGVHFALGGGALAYCVGVGFAGFLEGGAGALDEGFCSSCQFMCGASSKESEDLVARCLFSKLRFRSSRSSR